MFVDKLVPRKFQSDEIGIFEGDHPTRGVLFDTNFNYVTILKREDGELESKNL